MKGAFIIYGLFQAWLIWQKIAVEGVVGQLDWWTVLLPIEIAVAVVLVIFYLVYEDSKRFKK